MLTYAPHAATSSSIALQGGHGGLAAPSNADQARAVIRSFLMTYSPKGDDLLVVGETGGGGLEYDATQRVLKVPKPVYDDLVSAFQMLGAQVPWVTFTFPSYMASPLAKKDIVARLQQASTRTIYFIMSTSNTGLSTAKDVTGAIADFYSGLFSETPPGASGRRSKWLVPALIGMSVVVAGSAFFLLRRHRS